MAFIAYLAAALVLFGEPLWSALTQHCVCTPGTQDEGIFAWALAWWPHALLHGLNPFYSHIVYAPQGFDIAHGALVPGAALILAPVTEIAGPLRAYDVAMLLSPVLAAFFAFLLCRRLTRAFWPSLVGGWLFGFSTYMLGQLGGHLHMILVFLVPAIVHLTIRAFSEEISGRRFAVLLALALVLQFLFSVEIFASLTLFGAAALALGFVLGDGRVRARLRPLLGPIALAYLAAAVIVSPYLYYALKPGALPAVPFRTNKFSNDLLGFVVPTQITALGGPQLLSTSQRFSAGFVEGGAYLGLPLLAMTLLGFRAGWRRPEVRIIAASVVVVLLCSLGAHLRVDGSSLMALPWSVIGRLPALNLMLPARFVLYGSLICSVVAAMWITSTRHRAAAWLLALLAVVSLWPAVGNGYWQGAPDLPSLFASSAYRHVIGPRDRVLVLPVGIAGAGMLWQAQARLSFAMSGGYVVPPEAPDPYKRFAIYPTLTHGAAVRDQKAAAARFLAAEHVTAAMLDPHSVPASPWVGILERLGWRARAVGGVVLLRPRGPLLTP